MAEAKKFITDVASLTVLIAPLDWGLGHTTRCIPIIKILLKFSCEVIVACNSTQKKILIAEFPAIRFVELQGYNIKYASNKIFTKFRLLIQVPKILTAIKTEHSWLADFIHQNKVDFIISDNRYGFFNKAIPSLFMTHQLGLHSGFGSIADAFAQQRLYKLINKFSVCWVPDNKGENAIAGKLSHPKKLPAIPVRYIGPLTRLQQLPSKVAPTKILVLLSGPEPQRSILENRLLRQLEEGSYSSVFVRGTMTPWHGAVPRGRATGSSHGVEIIDFVSSSELQELLATAEFVICRSGYSSIMDLLSLQKKTILVPTPGQGEQEYLGSFLMEKKLALCINQDNFNFHDAIASAKIFPYKTYNSSAGMLENALTELFESYLCRSKGSA